MLGYIQSDAPVFASLQYTARVRIPPPPPHVMLPLITPRPSGRDTDLSTKDGAVGKRSGLDLCAILLWSFSLPLFHFCAGEPSQRRKSPRVDGMCCGVAALYSVCRCAAA